MRQPTISLCMIVRDEAEHLEHCLSSAAAAVDEIIVVDTGSLDDTVSVAKQFDARVISFPWQDDFSLARNAGLDHAKGDWILYLDADEVLDTPAKETLRTIAAHKEFEGFLLQIHNYVGWGDQGATINPVLRMFRNRPEHRFEGRIHEQIATSICTHRPNAAFHITDVKIHHYGYLKEIVKKKDKVMRNFQLLQQILAERPDDPFHLYNIGVEYLRINEIEQAIEAFRKARILVDPKVISYAHLLYKYEIRCLQALNQPQEALLLCEEGISLYPDYTDLHHLRGVIHSTLGNQSEAATSLHRALEIGAAPAGFHTEEGFGTFQTCYALGLLEESNRNYQAAVMWYVKSLQWKSSLNPPLYRIFHLLKCTNSQAEIIFLLDECFQLKSPEAVVKVANMLITSDCVKAALALLDQSRDSAIAEYKQVTRIKCHLLAGESKQAKRYLSQTKSEQMSRLRAWIAWVENGKDGLPKHLHQATVEDFQFLTKIAFVNGKRSAVPGITQLWLDALRKEEASALPFALLHFARTFVQLADHHLENLCQTTMYKQLICDTRLATPHEDGF